MGSEADGAQGGGRGVMRRKRVEGVRVEGGTDEGTRGKAGYWEEGDRWRKTVTSKKWRGRLGEDSEVDGEREIRGRR